MVHIMHIISHLAPQMIQIMELQLLGGTTQRLHQRLSQVHGSVKTVGVIGGLSMDISGFHIMINTVANIPKWGLYRFRT